MRSPRGCACPGGEVRAADPEIVRGAVEGEQGFGDGIGPDRRKAFEQGLPGGETQDFPRSGEKDEAHVRMRQREAGQQFLRALLFGGGSLQELEAGGDGGEQVAHLHDRAPLQAARPLLGEHAVFHLDEGGLRGLASRRAIGRFHAEAGYGGDARQRSAAEPEGTDAPTDRPCWRSCSWRGGDGEFQLGGGDAPAVVADADKTLSAVFQRDFHQRSPGVEAVFHEFLDHACRTPTTLALWAIAAAVRGREQADAVPIGERTVLRGCFVHSSGIVSCGKRRKRIGSPPEARLFRVS